MYGDFSPDRDDERWHDTLRRLIAADDKDSESLWTSKKYQTDPELRYLYGWANTQKWMYKKGILFPDRARELERISFFSRFDRRKTQINTYEKAFDAQVRGLRSYLILADYEYPPDFKRCPGLFDNDGNEIVSAAEQKKVATFIADSRTKLFGSSKAIVGKLVDKERRKAKLLAINFLYNPQEQCEWACEQVGGAWVYGKLVSRF